MITCQSTNRSLQSSAVINVEGREIIEYKTPFQVNQVSQTYVSHDQCASHACIVSVIDFTSCVSVSVPKNVTCMQSVVKLTAVPLYTHYCLSSDSKNNHEPSILSSPYIQVNYSVNSCQVQHPYYSTYYGLLQF